MTAHRMSARRGHGRRPWWLAATAVAAALPLAALAPTASYALSRQWSGNIWMGSAATTPSNTLATVRGAINASTGTAATLTGAGVGIALIDTGVAAVPGLPAAQVVNGPDLSFESQADNLRYLDTYGHGTHMAGIMIGNDTATGTKGIAPKAKLTSIKVGTSNGAADVSQMIAAVDWVIAHKNDDAANPIRVLNLSYGSGGNPVQWTDPVQYVAEQAWKAGIVVVVAGGNLGTTGTKLTDPATDQYVVAVGASSTKGTVTNADDDYCSFNILDNTRPLDFLAPGESIVSLSVPGSNIDATYPAARLGTTLFRGSGTSQATAVSSAAIALLLQYKPSLTPDQVKFYLQQSRTWPTVQNAQNKGIGFLNVNAAIAKLATNTANPQTWSQSNGKGLLEAARGTSHLVHDNATLSGESSVWGSWSSSSWSSKSAARTAWSGGSWLGTRLAGDGWTGTSWASKTWGSATWAGAPWGGGSWTDPDWSGHYWNGHYWSINTWNGHYWTSDDWSSSTWS